MTRILIVYATDYGNTEQMARAAAEGVSSVTGAEAVIKAAEDCTSEDFTASDGVLLGTPVHMGAPDWRVKKMIDTVCSGLWMQDRMVGKVSGVFATGSGFGGAGGGVELALLSLLNNFAELGMVIVPLPKNTADYARGGLQWGPYGRSADEAMAPVGVTPEALAVSRRHGANIARAAQAVQGKGIFLPE